MEDAPGLANQSEVALCRQTLFHRAMFETLMKASDDMEKQSQTIGFHAVAGRNGTKRDVRMVDFCDATRYTSPVITVTAHSPRIDHPNTSLQVARQRRSSQTPRHSQSGGRQYKGPDSMVDGNQSLQDASQHRHVSEKWRVPLTITCFRTGNTASCA